MADTKSFVKSMRNRKVPENVIDKILSVDYQQDGNAGQENANFYAKALPRSEELLGFDLLAGVMFDRACCKSGYRLTNARQMNKEYSDKPLAQKLKMLGTLRYMGHPSLTEEGDILTEAVGSSGASNMSCPCWRLQGRRPADERMPLSYCLCCAGHFMFHYQHALNLKLRVKRVVSSILNSEGNQPCVFLYEIVK